MKVINIPLTETGQVHPLAADYLRNEESLKKFYRWPLAASAIRDAITERSKYPVDRNILVSSLRDQYTKMDAGFFALPGNKQVEVSLEKLADANTFTITTGHQLNIFTGPLFFIYKIISAIRYAEKLKADFPAYDFIPVYWMASEDHDFEEISEISIWGKKLKWETSHGGPTGRLHTESLKPLLDDLKNLAGEKKELEPLLGIFEMGYTNYSSLSQSTRFIVNELFRQNGLIIMDAGRKELKKQLMPVLQSEIFENASFHAMKQTMEQLGKNYDLPVKPREINVFYLSENRRDRIIRDGETFKAGDGISWSAREMESELNSHPERFSPNVVLRPVYQEIILPNLAYIGGNNEIAYWLELLPVFERFAVFFPQLVIRDSFLWIGRKNVKEITNLHLTPADLLKPEKELKDLFYERHDLEHPSENQADALISGYSELRNKLQGLPGDLVGPIVKQINIHEKDLKNWKSEIHKRMLQSEQKSLEKLGKIYSSVFPESVFQERHDNLLMYYLQYGSDFFKYISDAADPISGQLHILMDEN